MSYHVCLPTRRIARGKPRLVPSEIVRQTLAAELASEVAALFVVVRQTVAVRWFAEQEA